ncbi:MAG: DUF4838 domain-containing protein [Clostridia bacterium]|nr:DUF4838 domain-containing protein [Clostridia bacterium]
MTKRILSAILCTVMLLSVFTVGSVAAEDTGLPFADVKSTKWFYEAVKTVYDAGFMNGKSDTKFEPNATMTRAELVTLLSRLADADTNGKAEALTFKDTKKTAWFAAAVGWAVEAGLANGYEDNTFRPNAPILRQELAALLVRFFDYVKLEMDEAPEIDVFTDAKKIPSWARDNVETLRKTGLIKGDANGNFNPKSTASRAEVATITMRMLDDLTKIREYPLYSLSINGVDISAFKIVYNENPSESVLTAVEEIKKYVKLAIGAELTSEVYTSLDGNVIYLDDTMHEDDETYTIKNAGDDFIIGGSGVRGVLYGAYEFLEQCVGWRFLDDYTDYMAKSGNVNIAGVDFTKEQYFMYRDAYWACYMSGHPNIAAKRRLNSATASFPEYGGGLVMPGCHTFAKYTGTTQQEQPCLSSEETYRQIVDGVLADLAADPGRWVISVSQNDNGNYCKCEECLAAYEDDGQSGQMISFVNRVAEEVEKHYPDVMIHTFAYQYTQKAPEKVKPRDNVLVQLCSIDCCFRHSIESGKALNAEFKQDLNDWAAICDNLYIWDYTTNFSLYIMPHCNLSYEVLAGNIRLFHENNVVGVFEQGAYNTGGSAEFAELRSYLISKLLQDPYMSEEEFNRHRDEFLRGYYGDGWENMVEFLDWLLEKPYFKAFCQGCFSWDGIDSWKTDAYKNDREKVEAWFDAAYEAADTELQKNNLRRCRIGADFMILNGIWEDMYTNGTDETRKEVVDMAFHWQAEMQEFDVHMAEKFGVPNFTEITRPPMDWKKCWGNTKTEINE